VIKPLLFTLLLLSILFQSCTKERIELAWTEIEVPTTAHLEDVHFFDKDTGIAVGGIRYEHGLLFSTNNGGTSWQIDTISPQSLYDIEVIDRNTFNVLGHYGNLYQFYNGNNLTFSRQLNSMEFYWNLNFYDFQTGVAAGGNAYLSGGLYLFNVNQELRDTFIADLPHEMNEAVFLDIKTLVAVGFGAIYRSTDGGLSWTRHEENGDNFKAVCFPSAQIGYTVGASGKILKTTDAGITWQQQNRSDNLVSQQVEFNDVYFLDDDNGYIIGNHGTFWTTNNGGEDWKIIDNFPNIDFLAISMTGNQGYVVSKNGRMFTFLVD